MKSLTLLMAFIVIQFNANAQSFNEDKTAFSNFLKRMYVASPFEGVKVVDDYEKQYLISVISLDKAKYTSESVMNRVAQVKAQSQASTFLNGASISMDLIINTREVADTKGQTESITETMEQIKQNSIGFSKGLELLTNFDSADGKRVVFVYMRELDTKTKNN